VRERREKKGVGGGEFGIWGHGRRGARSRQGRGGASGVNTRGGAEGENGKGRDGGGWSSRGKDRMRFAREESATPPAASAGLGTHCPHGGVGASVSVLLHAEG